MLRRTVLTLTLALFGFVLATNISDAKTKKGFKYKVEKKKITILRCKKNKKKIVVPAKIEGKKVTKIEAGTFSKATKAQTIVLPKYLEELPTDEADYRQRSILKKENMVSTAFTGCKKLKNIRVTKGNKYFTSVKGVLYSKGKWDILNYPAGRKKSSYKIHEKTHEIASGAFENAKYLKMISYGKKLDSIRDGAFYRAGLRKINIGKNISYVSNGFLYCTKLKTVHIGEKTDKMFDRFIGCTSLEKITVSKKNKWYYAVDGVLYGKENGSRWLRTYPPAKEAKTYTFPVGVVSDGWNFVYCKNLREVKYSENCDIRYDFFRCQSITVTLPDVARIERPETEEDSGVDYVEWDPFVECKNMTMIGKADAFMQSYAKKKGFTYIVRK